LQNIRPCLNNQFTGSDDTLYRSGRRQYHHRLPGQTGGVECGKKFFERRGETDTGSSKYTEKIIPDSNPTRIAEGVKLKFAIPQTILEDIAQLFFEALEQQF